MKRFILACLICLICVPYCYSAGRVDVGVKVSLPVVREIPQTNPFQSVNTGGISPSTLLEIWSKYSNKDLSIKGVVGYCRMQRDYKDIIIHDAQIQIGFSLQ